MRAELDPSSMISRVVTTSIGAIVLGICTAGAADSPSDPSSDQASPPSQTLERTSDAVCSCVGGDSDCRAVTEVMILLDFTSSMDGGSRDQQRLAIAHWAAFDVIDAIPDQLPTAVFALYDDATEIRPLEPLDANGRSQLRRSLIKVEPFGSGKLHQLVSLARQRLVKKHDSARPLIVVVTDGEDCDPYGAFGDLGGLYDEFGERLHVHIVGVGHQGPTMTELRELADKAKSQGHFSAVVSSEDLATALTGVRDRLQSVRECQSTSAAAIQQTLVILHHEKEVLIRSVAEFERTITINRKTIEELRSTIESRDLRIRELEQESLRLRVSVRNRQTSIDRGNAQITHLHSQIARQKTALAVRNVRILEFEKEVTRLTEQNRSREVAVANLDRALADATQGRLLNTIGLWSLATTALVLLCCLGFALYRIGSSAGLERENLRLGARLNGADRRRSTRRMRTRFARGKTQATETVVESPSPDGTTVHTAALSREVVATGEDSRQTDDDRQPSPAGNSIAESVGEPSTESDQSSEGKSPDGSSSSSARPKDGRVGRQIVANFLRATPPIQDVDYFCVSYRRVAEAYRQVHGIELPPFGTGSQFDRLWAVRIDPQESWLEIDEQYRGRGSAGAMASIGHATIVEQDEIWMGELLPGAVVQTWKRRRDFEHARDGIRASDDGYSFIFIEYILRDGRIVGMRIADEESHRDRILSPSDFEYWIGGNLHA